MDKPAETQFPIHDLLRLRWSPRAFDGRIVGAELLGSLLEALRWAPSSNNAQPWRILVGSKSQPAEYDRLLHCLVDGNQVWAKQAPLLLLTVAKMTFDDGSPNRHAYHDVGLATENLLLQATASGLVAHAMAGFHLEQARLDCQIPPGYEPVAMIAVGYPGDADRLPDRLRERERKPRERDALTELVYAGQWGAPLPVTKA